MLVWQCAAVGRIAGKHLDTLAHQHEAHSFVNVAAGCASFLGYSLL